MKKLLLALGLFLAPAVAFGQCTGVFPANTICGNLTGSPAPPNAVPASTNIVGPGSSVIGDFATWGNTTGNQLDDFDLFAHANTWTAANVFSSTATFNALANFTSTFQIGGATKTFPSGASTLAGLGTNQTFTGNNTFSTGTDNFTGTFQLGGVTVSLPISSANGGTGVASPTTHTIPINQGASAQTNSGTGSLGQCLASSGASVDPAFVSGCMVLLNTLTASSSATLSDTTSLTSTYHSYIITFDNVIPATNSTGLRLQVHSGGVFPATSYLNSTLTFNTSANQNGDTVAVDITRANANQDTSSNVANGGISGVIRVVNPASTTNIKFFTGTASYVNTTTSNATFVGISGAWNGGNGAVDGFQLLFNSGNIASGVVRIYGLL